MKNCILLVHASSFGAAPGGNEALVVHWDEWEVPEGHVSLPARLADGLTAIRAEHAAWAYDFARLVVDGREVQDHLLGGESGLSMWWCSLLYERHPKMTPNLHTIYKLRAVERLLDAEGCDSLQLAGGDAAMARALEGVCRAAGRRFEWIAAAAGRSAQGPIAGGGLVRRLYAVCPPVVRAAVRYVHWWWKFRRRLPPVRLPEAPDGVTTATVATYFPNVDMQAAKEGRFRSRYWESLHDALNGRAQALGSPFVRWLFVRFPAPQISFGECLALRDRFRSERKDGFSFHYLEEFLEGSDLRAAWKRYLSLRRASLALEDKVRPAFHFAGSSLDFWHWAADDWAESFRGWRCLERCLQQRGIEAYVRQAGPQQWTIFPLENCPWERMLTHAVHEAGCGPVYGAQHSTIRPTDFRYFDDPRTFTDGRSNAFQPDAVRGNGASACAQWRDAGVPAERLGQVEALRYLYLADSAVSSSGTEGGSASAPAGGQKRLLVLTSFFRDETFAHLALLARAVQAGLLDGWNIVVKPHPYLPVEDELRRLLGRRADGMSFADGPMAAQLAPGVLVWASNSTTAALEAAIRGLAVMVMQPRDDFDLCPLQDVPGLPRTATLEDVRRALAAPRPLDIARDYLSLDPALPRWRRLLGL